jgi:hypothetical protein
MSRIYNTIGSLTTLKLHLEENNIKDFKSLKEVIDFQNSFSINRHQLITQHRNLIEEEKNKLNAELNDSETTIETQRKQTEQILTDKIAQLSQQLNISSNYIPTNFFQKTIKQFSLWKYIKGKLKGRKIILIGI